LTRSASTAFVGAACSANIPQLNSSVPRIQMRFEATAAKPKKPRNPYKVLGVKPSASVKDLKKAHRVLARKFHPDVPGGSHEKFQEIQDAFEQVKTGVWIKKAGEDSGRGGGDDGVEKPQNRYANFRFTTGGNRRKQSYDEAFTNLHKNKDSVEDDDIDLENEKSSKRKGAPMFGPDSPLFQAWSRLIVVWSCAFVVLRVGLFLCFPPKYEKVHKKKMSTERLQRKPPPPKPLASTTPVLG